MSARSISRPAIGSLGIDDNAPSLTEAEKAATVADLLKARSGIFHAALYETPRMARLRPPRGSHPPEFWYYNNWDFNALGTIYERAVGHSCSTAFDEKIARPIGMQDYQPSDGEYVRGRRPIMPLIHSHERARSARFALLYPTAAAGRTASSSPRMGSREHAVLRRRLYRSRAGPRLWLHVVDRVSARHGAPTVRCRRERSRRWGPRDSMPS